MPLGLLFVRSRRSWVNFFCGAKLTQSRLNRTKSKPSPSMFFINHWVEFINSIRSGSEKEQTFCNIVGSVINSNSYSTVILKCKGAYFLDRYCQFFSKLIRTGCTINPIFQCFSFFSPPPLQKLIMFVLSIVMYFNVKTFLFLETNRYHLQSVRSQRLLVKTLHRTV